MKLFDKLFKRQQPQSGKDMKKEGGSKTMGKDELLSKVATRTGHQAKAVDEIFDALVSEIEESLNSGENVMIRDFATFKVVARKERVVNDFNGKKIKVKAHNAIVITPGKALKACAPKKLKK